MKNNLISTDKKIVVIAGGSGYLGSFIVDKLLAEGMTVVIIGLNKPVNFKDRESLNFIEADLTNWEIVQQVASQVQNNFGEVVSLIYAASAPLVRQKLLDLSQTDFLSQYTVNVSGAFNFYKAFAGILASKGALIGLTTKAINSRGSLMVAGSYLSAKLALRGLLKILASELKDTRVYEVAPAFMPGGLNKDLPNVVIEFIKNKSHINEIAKPEEVANLIYDLINDQAASFSGKVIIVPGRTVIDL